jgi:hypothetical protein
MWAEIGKESNLMSTKYPTNVWRVIFSGCTLLLRQIEAASYRRAARARRLFHDDEARSLQAATILAIISPLSRTCFRPL